MGRRQPSAWSSRQPTASQGIKSGSHAAACIDIASLDAGMQCILLPFCKATSWHYFSI